MVTYIETSALLRWLFSEEGSSKTQNLLQRSKVVCTSIITFMEAARSIQRAHSQNAFPFEQRDKLQKLLADLKSGWIVMALTEQIQINMSHAFSHEPVRTLDAVHLLTAMEFKKGFPKLKMATFDKRIEKNLKELNLKSALTTD